MQFKNISSLQIKPLLGKIINAGNATSFIHYFKRIIIVLSIYLLHTILYNFVSIHHVNDNYHLLTDLDTIFPFVPEMVYIYMSFYVVILISVFFLKTDGAFYRIILSIIGTLLITYPLFYLFPAYYPAPSFETDTFTTQFLKWCHEADVPNNTFPSLHVSLSFTIALGINHYRKTIGKVYIIWAIMIGLSTIMIRKHFLIDALGGIVIAGFCYNVFVLGRTAQQLIDTKNKLKTSVAYFIENNLPVKRFKPNFITLVLIFLKIKE